VRTGIWGGRDEQMVRCCWHPMLGLPTDGASARVLPMWRVDDVAAAVERVRAAGGTATDPERKPYGTTADCTDDQGMPFSLGDV
jgi:uncharacterized protein